MSKVAELTLNGVKYAVSRVPWEREEGGRAFVLSYNGGEASEPMTRDGVLECLTLRVHVELESLLAQAG